MTNTITIITTISIAIFFIIIQPAQGGQIKIGKYVTFNTYNTQYNIYKYA